ncbi:c-type cytochrome domain-containing protein [Agriterribacter sp.]|uniref:c-type cytochrome domain-containing protein n=1 Tax=Agriterribacter sp. TaxID=2821509 RepID=UPI002CDC8357|nr:c-type cytochrome domain-containing protein [Agriterribacter sp.]HRP55629.1 FN3 associated domain-containing protein [Agriterribacter sp.]
MNKRVRFFAEQLLVVFNVFIVFLLLFESKLEIPAWLQPVGRMHPLLLHFPIVLLLLAIVLQWYSASRRQSNNFFHVFSQHVLLSGALLSAVTVVMGLFLSREEGYTGGTLQWHKWTGVAIFFLASIIYWVAGKPWYKGMLTKAAGALVVVSLILAGHFGASLTHGEDFILQPLAVYYEAPPVPIDKAIVFDHVVRPIFEKKCMSCHNPDKLKGELILADSASIVKGGKTGKLFVPGNPGISLLMERVHLPLEEKKHMPPKGKTQLTENEIVLLTLWIRNETPFSQKVIDLPPGDSLRLMAASVLKPVETPEERYDFSAADEKTIAKLNTDYRSITPLAKESPALEVNVYNRADYTKKQLEELTEIKSQIVSLNLNKMPVTDEDLKIIGQFENLRKLDLNFTDITANGLKELAPLKHLNRLTLSGTKVNYSELKAQISALKNLKTVSIWNTAITPAEAEQLQAVNKHIRFIEGFVDDGSNPLKLNPPQINNSSVIFDQPMALQLFHPVKGVEIRYTTDGSEPDSITSPVFDNKTVIKENALIKAKGFKKGWYGSDMASFDFFKSSFKPDSVRLLYPLNSVHQGEGAHTFFNTTLGVIGANNPAWANNFAGVRNNDMGIISEFKEPVTLSSVGLHYMIEEATGILPPALVEVWGGENENQMKLLVKMKPPLPAKGDKPSLTTVEGKFKPETISCLKIVAKPHVDGDRRRLLLVDEMFLN